MYYQPNLCTTHTEREWAGGTFLRQQKEVPPAHAQWVYLELGDKESPRLSTYVIVIRHGIGGKVIPAKMAQLAES